MLGRHLSAAWQQAAWPELLVCSAAGSNIDGALRTCCVVRCACWAMMLLRSLLPMGCYFAGTWQVLPPALHAITSAGSTAPPFTRCRVVCGMAWQSGGASNQTEACPWKAYTTTSQYAFAFATTTCSTLLWTTVAGFLLRCWRSDIPTQTQMADPPWRKMIGRRGNRLLHILTRMLLLL